MRGRTDKNFFFLTRDTSRDKRQKQTNIRNNTPTAHVSVVKGEGRKGWKGKGWMGGKGYEVEWEGRDGVRGGKRGEGGTRDEGKGREGKGRGGHVARVSCG